MKHKIKINNPSEFHLGMRVKLPFGGWWFGSKKKVEWVKGKIIKLGDIREDGKIHYVLTYCYSKKYGTLGAFMSLGEDCNKIYKTR